MLHHSRLASMLLTVMVVIVMWVLWLELFSLSLSCSLASYYECLVQQFYNNSYHSKFDHLRSKSIRKYKNRRIPHPYWASDEGYAQDIHQSSKLSTSRDPQCGSKCVIVYVGEENEKFSRLTEGQENYGAQSSRKEEVAEEVTSFYRYLALL